MVLLKPGERMAGKRTRGKERDAAERWQAPPQNIEAEQALLGAILLETGAVLIALERLRPEDFYLETHRIIYGAMVDLFNRSQPRDIIAVTNLLRDTGQLETVGGPAYLASLTDTMPFTAHVGHYLDIIQEKSLLRRLIGAAAQIHAACFEKQGPAGAILDEAEAVVFAISASRSQSAFRSVRDYVNDSFERINRLSGNNDPITGVPTGFESFDALTAGLQPANLIIIDARPGMGKTALAMNIVQNVAVRAAIPVGVFSLEMSGNELAMRMLCSIGHVDLRKVRTGQLQGERDWQKLAKAVGILENAPIYIDETPAITILELRAKARRMKVEHNIGLVVVDYLQLMKGPRHARNREQEVSEISRSLKALAKELDIPVVALSQLNRAMTSRKENRRPQLSDLRDSGAIEQDADIVCFIHREEGQAQGPAVSQRDISELIIGKQRNGPTGTIRMAFLKEYTTFENLAWQ
jgi:replicative DNA helicase